MGTQVKFERTYNTKEGQRITRYYYESLTEFGNECINLANQQYVLEDGLYKYQGEIIDYYEIRDGGSSDGAGGGGGGGGAGGGEGGVYLTGDQYELQISTSMEPLESHPRWAGFGTEFWICWKTWKQDKTSELLTAGKLGGRTGQKTYVRNGYWDPTHPAQPGEISLFVSKWMSGVTEYLAPRVIARQTVYNSPPTNLSGVGRLSSPPYGGGWNGNWILNGVSARRNLATGMWEATYEWLGSSQKPWDIQLYGGG